MLGFRFSLKKGQRGRKVDWIGGEFAIEPGMMTTKLSEERAQRLKDTLETLDESKGMVATKVVIKAASVAAAAASVVPRARPFVAHLWGAAFDAQKAASQQRPGTRSRPKDLMFIRRCSHAVHVLEHYWARARSSSGSGHWHQ